MTANESRRVLVTYATKYGATAEIAEKIAEVLHQSGLAVEVRPVKEVRDLGPYTAVVLGSAVYIGRWRKEAVRFVENNLMALSERDVWLFSCGPTGEGDPVELLQGWRYPERLKPLIDAMRPRDIAVFHGDLEPDKLNFIEKTMIKNVKAPTGDFRDWEAISGWATAIAAAITPTREQPVP